MMHFVLARPDGSIAATGQCTAELLSLQGADGLELVVVPEALVAELRGNPRGWRVVSGALVPA